MSDTGWGRFQIMKRAVPSSVRLRTCIDHAEGCDAAAAARATDMQLLLAWNYQETTHNVGSKNLSTAWRSPAVVPLSLGRFFANGADPKYSLLGSKNLEAWAESREGKKILER